MSGSAIDAESLGLVAEHSVCRRYGSLASKQCWTFRWTQSLIFGRGHLRGKRASPSPRNGSVNRSSYFVGRIPQLVIESLHAATILLPALWNPRLSEKGLSISHVSAFTDLEFKEFGRLTISAINEIVECGVPFGNRVFYNVERVVFIRLPQPSLYLRTGKIVMIDAGKLRRDGRTSVENQITQILLSSGLLGRMYHLRINPKHQKRHRVVRAIRHQLAAFARKQRATMR